MTVKQLRDLCDWYIRTDSCDSMKLSSSRSEAQTYAQRKSAREQEEVLFCDDSMCPRYFSLNGMRAVFERRRFPDTPEFPKWDPEQILMLIPDDEVLS